MYWVQKNVRKARPLRKSRDEMRPATGRRRKSVRRWRKEEMVESWGMASRW